MVIHHTARLSLLRCWWRTWSDGSRAFVEFHHLIPYAAGGRTTVENLALRCHAHNAYEAAVNAGVLERPLLDQLKDPLSAHRPMKAVFDQNFVKRIHGPNVMTGGSKMEVTSTKGFRPRGLDTGMGDTVYFSGNDASGAPGVFKVADQTKALHVLTVKLKAAKPGESSRTLRVITDLKEDGEIEFQTKIQEAFQQAQAKAATRMKELEQEARKVLETLGDRAQAELKIFLEFAQNSLRIIFAFLNLAAWQTPCIPIRFMNMSQEDNKLVIIF